MSHANSDHDGDKMPGWWIQPGWYDHNLNLVSPPSQQEIDDLADDDPGIFGLGREEQPEEPNELPKEQPEEQPEEEHQMSRAFILKYIMPDVKGAPLPDKRPMTRAESSHSHPDYDSYGHRDYDSGDDASYGAYLMDQYNAGWE